METEAAHLQEELRNMLVAVRTRQYFFEYVARIYESGVCTLRETRHSRPPAPQKPQSSKKSEDAVILDEKVEQALQKAARVLRGTKPARAQSPAPRPAATLTVKTEQPPKPAPAPRYRFVVDEELFARYFSEKRKWKGLCVKVLATTAKGTKAAAAAQNNFMRKLQARSHPTEQISHIDTCIAREISISPLSHEILQILQDSEICHSIKSTAALPKRERFTLDEATQVLRVSVLCGWLQDQVEQLRDSTHSDTLLACCRLLQGKAVVSGPVLTSLAAEHKLLTRLKAISSSEDAQKLLTVYTHSSLYSLRRCVFPCIQQVAAVADLASLRPLHSILRSDGKKLLTAVRSPD